MLLGTSSCNSASPLETLDAELIKAREVAPRSIETCDKTVLHRVSADTKKNWDGGGRSLCRECRRGRV